jgi:hypothetical protein
MVAARMEGVPLQVMAADTLLRATVADIRLRLAATAAEDRRTEAGRRMVEADHRTAAAVAADMGGKTAPDSFPA